MADYSLKAVFGLDATGLKTGLKQVNSAVGELVTKWGKWAALAGAAAFTALAKGAIELAGSLMDTSTNLGINVEALQALEAQHKRNGVSNEELVKAMQKTKNAVIDAAAGNQQALKSLDDLHLSASKLIKLPLDQQYAAIAKAATNAKDQNVAYNAVAQLFGDKIGPKMMGSLKELGEEGLPGVVKAAKEAGQVMSAETIVALDRAGDAIDDFKRKATVAVGDIIVNFRSEEGLQLLGMKLLKIAGQFGGWLIDELNNSLTGLGGLLIGTFKGVLNYLQDGLVNIVEGIARMLNAVLPEKFEISIGDLERLKSSGKGIGDEIRDAINKSTPTTFSKDLGAVMDREIADMQKTVDRLNKVDLGKEADKLRSAGEAVKASVTDGGNSFNKSVDAALDEFFNTSKYVTTNFTIVADSAGDAWNAMVEASDKAAKAAREFAGYVIQIQRGGTSYEDQSTASLQGVRSRLSTQLTDVSPFSNQQIGNATFQNDFGAANAASALRAELQAVNKELSQRQAVLDLVKRSGESAARSQFGDTLTDRALRDLQDSSTRTSTAVEKIAAGLTKSGFLQ